MAEAWEDMTDIQRASALELMGGKRQANVLSALIQNFDTVEKVIETSANSAGSALKENERYLDSIQGKIDQFNNAMQAMWSNTLDSDVVKWFVNLGTELIRIVDTLGLIPSILLSIASFKILQSLFKGTDIIGFIKSIGALTMGTKVFEAETRKAAFALMGETINTKLAGSALVEYAIKMGLATSADVAKMTTTQLLGLGFKALGVAIWGATKAIVAFLFTNPVGWAILAVTAVVAAVAAWNKWGATTENLREKLDELKSELSDIRSELDSVNSELETTNERMAELLAKDKLTFEEQEELDRLRATNDELERRKELLEDEEKDKSGRVGRQAARVVDSAKDDYGFWESATPVWRYFKTTAEEDTNKNIEDYKKIKEKMDNASSLKEREKYQKKLDKEAEKIDEYIATLSEALDGVEYGDSEESDEALDYLAELQGKYGIARGSAGAKTNAIKGLFNKDEFTKTKAAIDGYVDALAKGDTSAADSIANIINSNKDLVQDLEARGLKAQDAIDYFTKLGSEENYATLDGKIAEMQAATSKMQVLLSNTESADFTGLFDKDGEVSETAIAEYFQGTSEATRAEIARIVKDINEGEISIENALKQFEIFSIQSSLDIYITEVQTNFKDVFVDLEDADGLVDTFEELGEAIGSTAAALKVFNKAEAEMANSGRVSIETALQLMEYTDDYGSVLEVVDGKLQLVDNAEEVLIQTRIDAIKTSAEASLSDATNAYNKAVLATQEYKSALTSDMSAEVVAKSWEKVLAAAAGLWEGIKSLITDESWSDAYNRGYNETLSSITGYEIEYNDSGLQALADAEAEAKAVMEAAQDRVELANQLTPETLESINDSDDLDSKEDAAKKKLDEKMEQFQQEMDYWENRIGANQARYEQLQNEIDLLEAKGQKADASYYQEQIELENDRLSLLEQQKAAAQTYLDTLTEGSEEWWEVANTLNDIEGELDDVTASIVDLQDAIGEVDTYKFEEFNNRLDDITSKLSTIRDLIAPDGEEDWFDDQGQWTEEGVAVLGTYIQELETYKNGLAETQAELAKYTKSYEGNKDYYASLGIHSEQEYYDRTEELINQQYDYAQSISDTEQSVVDMYESNIDAVEEYTETLIDSYNDYIDSVKEALDAERDLYDFKKNVQKQSKDIAAIERRIASLSGSTNASDVAERRKLEAELYESRESLNDTYYDHARNAQDEALDAEQTAYEETMNNFIEGLRIGLETATANMDEFLMSVTSMVTLNADTVLTKYQETELPLGDAITNPWKAAIAKIGEYDGDALELMNKWTQGGFFDAYKIGVSDDLSSPWKAGQTAVDAFKTSVDTQMKNVVSAIETNVATASGKLSTLYQQIQYTANKATEVGGGDYTGGGEDYTGDGKGDGGGGGGETAAQKREKARKAAQDYVDKKGFSEGDKARWGQDANFLPLLRNLINAGGSINDLKGKVYAQPKTSGTITGYSVSGLGGMHLGADDFTLTIGGKGYKLKTNHDEVNSGTATQLKGVVSNPSKNTVAMLNKQLYVYFGGTKKSWKKIDWSSDYAGAVNAWYNKLNGYAKGTTGTTHDEWAITDEPQFGDELVLVPGKDGNLSFMRKGTGVVPADMTQKLFELAQIPTSDLMNKNLTAVVPNITKNDFKNEFNFESLVHVDTVDSDTLPKLEKMVDKKIDDFSKALNYSLKRFAR